MTKFTQLLLLSLICSIFSFNKSYSQWEELSTIYGGNSIAQIVETSNKLMGISISNLYFSDKDTIFWSKEEDFEDHYPIYIAAANDTLFYLYRSNEMGFSYYLRISFNEGLTWENPILICDQIDMNVTIDYRDETIRLCGNMDGQCQIRKSIDFGATWEIESMLDENLYINKLFHSNDTHLLFYVVNQTGNYSVFTYSIESSAWFEIPNSNQDNNQVYAVIQNDRVFIAKQEFDGLKIFSCNMDGSDDQLVHANSSSVYFHGFHELNNRLVYAMTASNSLDARRFYVSTDDGNTFELSNSTTSRVDFKNVVSLESSEAISLGFRLFKISQDLQQYSYIEDGLTLRGADYITSINGILYVSNYSTGFFKSLDDGYTFENITNSNGIPYGQILNKADTLFYAAIDSNFSAKFVRSTENDLNPEYLPGAPNSLTLIVDQQTAVIFNGRIFALNFLNWQNQNKLITSNDFGNTWQELESPSDDYGIFNVLNGKLYFYSHNLYRYDSSNNTWIEIYSPILSDGYYENCRLKSIGENLWVKNEDGYHAILLPDEATWVDNTNLIIYDVVKIGNAAYGIGWSDLLVSFDDGQNWLSSGIYLPSSHNYRRMTAHDSDLYIYGGYSSEIYKLTSPIVTPGKVYFDSNNNGQFDAPETGISNVLVISQNFPSYIMSDVAGNFAIFNTPIPDTLTLQLDSPYQTSVPDSTFLINQNELFIGIQIPDSISDFMMDAVILEAFRPGFSSDVTLVVKNLGSIIQSGELLFTLPDQVLFNSASILPTNQVDNVIAWSIDNLSPFEIRYINLNLYTNVSAVVGDSLFFEGSISPYWEDIDLSNNSIRHFTTVVGSYDPNDKACSRGEFITPSELNNNNEFEYLIRFQNTGTYYAENVVIKDTISSYFDLSTLRIIAASDTMNVTFGENNLVNFNFPLIFLPDSITNEPGSHGFVKYAIRTKPNLQLGTVLRNTAYIYFDFNTPIITNTVETVYDLSIGMASNEDRSVWVYPNPTQATVRFMEYANATVLVTLTV